MLQGRGPRLQTLPPLQHAGLRGRAEAAAACSVQLHGVEGHVLQHHAVHRRRGLGEQRQLPRRVLLPDGGGRAELRRVVVAQPLVAHHVPRTQPLLGIFHEQPFDEILGLRGHAAPLLGVELEVSVLDVGEEVELALVALAARRPAAVPAAGAAEGRVAGQQDVEHHAEAPQVAPLVVREVLLRVLDEGLHDFGRHELRAAHGRQQQRRGVGAAARVELDPGAEVEVAELDRGERVPVHAENVLRLEVSVGDPLGVEEGEGGGDVPDDAGGLLLGEVFPGHGDGHEPGLHMHLHHPPGLDVVQQLAARHLLEDEVEPVRLLEILDQLDDVRVTLDTTLIDMEMTQDIAASSPGNGGTGQSP